MPLAAIAAACHLSHRFCIFPSGQDLRCFAPWRNCFALQGGLPAPPWVVLRCRWQTAESGCSRRRCAPPPSPSTFGQWCRRFSTQRENFGAGIRRNTADLGRLQPALGVITYRGCFRRCAPLLCGCFVAYAWGCPPLRTLIWCFQSRNTLPQLRIRGTLTPCQQTHPSHSSLFYRRKRLADYVRSDLPITFFHVCLIASKPHDEGDFGCGPTCFAAD